MDQLQIPRTYNEPTVIWRLQHPRFGGAHATIIPSRFCATAVWYLHGVPENAHDFPDWSQAIIWLNSVCWDLEREGWLPLEECAD